MGSEIPERKFFKGGDLVWAQFSDYPPWPAIVVECYEARGCEKTTYGQYKRLARDGTWMYWCSFYDEDTAEWVEGKNIAPFREEKVGQWLVDKSHREYHNMVRALKRLKSDLRKYKLIGTVIDGRLMTSENHRIGKRLTYYMRDGTEVTVAQKPPSAGKKARKEPNYRFKAGDIVWARYADWPFWPAQIVHCYDADFASDTSFAKCVVPVRGVLRFWCLFFGDSKSQWIEEDYIESFDPGKIKDMMLPVNHPLYNDLKKAVNVILAYYQECVKKGLFGNAVKSEGNVVGDDEEAREGSSRSGILGMRLFNLRDWIHNGASSKKQKMSASEPSEEISADAKDADSAASGGDTIAEVNDESSVASNDSSSGAEAAAAKQEIEELKAFVSKQKNELEEQKSMLQKKAEEIESWKKKCEMAQCTAQNATQNAAQIAARQAREARENAGRGGNMNAFVSNDGIVVSGAQLKVVESRLESCVEAILNKRLTRVDQLLEEFQKRERRFSNHERALTDIRNIAEQASSSRAQNGPEK